MCGIFGEFSSSSDERERSSFVESARRALNHRGPDGSGVWSDAQCVLGHTRLAIIDLSGDAAQPMVSASRRSHLVFNGEIYNYVELRAAMEPPPGGFRSTSDTEVLLEALDRDGLAAIERLHGMFAIALWRPVDRELLLVRDRFGKKPLYYAITPSGGLRFASEVSALLADRVLPRRTTYDRLAEYLQHGYVAAPRTGFVDIQSLPAGRTMRVHLDGDRVVLESPRRYWALPMERRPFASSDAWREAFDGVLQDAVKIRLRSDVPLGAFLSGGIDSSVVSLLASERLTRPLRTFTVDFAEARFSEGRYAAEVARRIGADHTELRLTHQAMLDLPDVAATYGDLHGDSSALPTLAVSREARRHVTVALSGDGGDELLGGYTRYASALRTVSVARRMPRPLARALRGVGTRVMPWWMRGATRLGRLDADLGAYYAREVRAYSLHPWPSVLRHPHGATWPDCVTEALEAHRARPDLLRLMATDADTYLLEDVLVKVDRASMAFGLEVRSPLLDHRLMELVMQAEPAWLTDGTSTKLPLRALYQSRLPANVFTRPKMGFGVPLESWLRHGLETTARERLFSARLSTVLERPIVERLLASHRAKRRDESSRIWHLLVLQSWLELWDLRVVS